MLCRFAEEQTPPKFQHTLYGFEPKTSLVNPPSCWEASPKWSKRHVHMIPKFAQVWKNQLHEKFQTPVHVQKHTAQRRTFQWDESQRGDERSRKTKNEHQCELWVAASYFQKLIKISHDGKCANLCKYSTKVIHRFKASTVTSPGTFDRFLTSSECV